MEYAYKGNELGILVILTALAEAVGVFAGARESLVKVLKSQREQLVKDGQESAVAPINLVVSFLEDPDKAQMRANLEKLWMTIPEGSS